MPALLERGPADELARAVCGVLSAAVVLSDPAVVLLGGPPPWRTSRRLAGARQAALGQLRDTARRSAA